MKQAPPHIDDTRYFRGKMMGNCYSLREGDYKWHKIQNCPNFKAKKYLNLAFILCLLLKLLTLVNGQLWVAL